jgi:endonuclease YncB( thermonuclease family)
MISYPVSGAMNFSAIVLKVHDGDTVTLDIDLNKYAAGKDRTFGFHIYLQSNRLHLHNSTRFYGINAPELATPEGKVSQQALAGQLPLGSVVALTTWLDPFDKYGRVLGRVRAGPALQDINQWMLDNGYAVGYVPRGMMVDD